MIQEIKLQGIAANPSERDSVDGQLDTANNFICEDAALRPMTNRKAIAYSKEVTNGEPRFIHATSDGDIYVLVEENTYKQGMIEFAKLINTQGDNTYEKSFSILTYTENGQVRSYQNYQLYGFKNILGFKSIGDILILNTADGIQYFRYLQQHYVYLGNALPQPKIQFALKKVNTGVLNVNALSREERINERTAYIRENGHDENFVASDMQELSAELAKTIYSIHERGYFILPFFVRCAIRLYDGTETMQTAPVLLMPTENGKFPLIYDQGRGSANFRGTYFSQRLLITIDQDFIQQTKLWTDIIQDLRIYISQPIYFHPQEIRSFSYNVDGEVTLFPVVADFRSRVYQSSSFYLLHRYKLDEIPAGQWNEVPVKYQYLLSLTARHTLDDDNHSHDIVRPKNIATYNRQLFFFNTQTIPFNGFAPNETMSIEGNPDGSIPTPTGIAQFIVELATNSGTKYLQSDESIYNERIQWYFYPSTKAIALYAKLNINVKDETTGFVKHTTVYRRYPLKAHDFLNGAYYLALTADDDDYQELDKEEFPTPTTDNTIQNSLSLVTYSKIENPFVFPAANAFTISNAEVITIAAAAPALSEGQSGQFPLYAFTNEGIWRLQFSEKGNIIATSFVTRDILCSTEAILSVDDSIIFPSQRGLIILSSAQTTPITDALIHREDPFLPHNLPAYPDIITLNNQFAEEYTYNGQLFSNTLQGNIKLAYDYTGQRILVFSDSIKHALVFSLRDKQWGCTNIQPNLYPLNSFPQTYAFDTETRRLYDLSQPTDTDNLYALAITRPIKLISPRENVTADTLKTLRHAILRGKFTKGTVGIVAYASRDLQHWHLIGSSTTHALRFRGGTPYKFFRFAIIARGIKQQDYISTITVEYDAKYQLRIR